MNSNLKILVINSDPHIFNNLVEQLKLKKYCIEQASNVNECIQIIHTDKPDAVIFNISLLENYNGDLHKYLFEDPVFKSIFRIGYSELKVNRENGFRKISQYIDLLIEPPYSFDDLLSNIEFAYFLNKYDYNLSSGLFKQIVETIGKGVLVLNRENNAVYINSKSRSLPGFRSPETNPVNILKLIAKTDHALFLNSISSVWRGQKINLVISMYGFDKTPVKFSVDLSPLTDENGNCEFILLTLSEVEKLNYADNISHSLNMPGLAFTHNPAAMWICDLKSLQIIQVNDSAVDLYGFSKEEYLSKNLYDILPGKMISAAIFLIQNTDEDEVDVNQFHHKINDGSGIVSDIKFFRIIFESQNSLLVISTNRSEPDGKYQRLLNSVRDTIFQTNLKGDLTFLNNSWETLTGYTAEESIGKNLFAYFHLNDRDHSSKLFFNILQSDLDDCRYEVRIISHMGEIKWIEMTASKKYSRSGEVTGTTGVMIDVTERVKAKNEAVANELKYRRLFERSNDAIMLLNGNKIVDVNDRATELFGIDKSLFSDYTPGLFSPKLQPDGSVSSIKLRQLISEAYKGNPQNFEWLVKKIDGTEVFTEVNLSTIELNDTVLLQILVKDITDQRNAEILRQSSERRLKALIENGTDIITMLDRNGIVIYSSPSVTRILGYEQEELYGQVGFDLVHPDDTQNVVNFFFDIIQKPGITMPISFRYKKKDGDYIFIESIGNNLLDEPDINAVIVNSRDINEWKLNEVAILNAKKEAEEMNKLKSSFLANMSHELRTPLVGILGFAELLQEDLQNPENKDMVNTILLSGQRLLQTLNSILDLSKIEANKMEINKTVIDVPETVRSSVKLFREFAAKRGLYLHTKISEDIIRCIADERLLVQVMNNLVSNAIKYTKDGGVTVKASTIVQNSKHMVKISVSDTGIGIAQQDFDLIFKEFRQVSEGFSRKYEGAGLGLTITKKFIELMGGSISVESEPGKGSTFSIYFEAVQDEPAGIKRKDAPDKVLLQETNQIRQAASKPKFLLVEDDDLSINVIVTFLKGHYKIDISKDGYDAVEMLKLNEYSGVLLDIDLGDGPTGIDVLEEMKKLPQCKDMPVIAVTAYAMKGDREKLLEAGCTDYISKPFVKESLVKAIENAAVKINR